MTQYLNSSQSSGGDGRVLWGSLGSPARLYRKLAGRADGARNGSIFLLMSSMVKYKGNCPNLTLVKTVKNKL
ncbi:UNVERIFIED_CONTAM: hypothetical protein K2H54_048496 [Gekko kuhli]